jgi:hypothetical protein
MNCFENALFDWLMTATFSETPPLPLFKLPNTNKNISGKPIAKNIANRSRKNRLVLILAKVKTVYNDFFMLTFP